MPRKQRNQKNPAEQEPQAHPATDTPNPFTDSSFLVSPTIGHSTLSTSRVTAGAQPTQPTQPTQRMSPTSPYQPGSEIANETPDDPTAFARATITLPPFDETAPTNVASSNTLAGAGRGARPTGAPTRDPHGDAQRALVRAVSEADRQLATRRDGEATPALIIRGAKKSPRTFGVVVPRRRGPRSFLAQFIVTMVTSVILFSVLTLATPLGQGAVFGSSFQAFANAVPIIPTATPTPPPTATPLPVGYNPGSAVIMNMISSVFGGYASGALAVARCESGYDPNAWNPYPIGNSHASGVFQILYPSTWDTTSYSGYSPYDANANINAAYQIFSRDGYSWREWQCQP